MQLQLVTVSFDTTQGRFPEAPLAEVPGEVVSVVEHFFTHDGLPRLLLVVHYRPTASPSKPATPRAKRIEHGAGLSGEASSRYARLRQWRASRASADGVPVYLILSNRQLAEIAANPPQSLSALQGIKGIGASKLTSYGPDILAILQAAEVPDAP